MLAAAAVPLFLLMMQAPSGDSIYAGQCAICHGQRGEGGRGPSLNRTKLRHASDDTALRRIIRHGLPGTGMPATWLNEVELVEVAGFVRSLSNARKPQAELPGNAERGRAIFAGKGACVQCHVVNGAGGAFGPALTGIAAQRSAGHLRQSIVDPGADVPPSFVLLRAETAGGRTVTGARVNEDTFSVQIRDAAGTLHSFWKTELKMLKKELGKSAMPSYATSLTGPELDDLVRYLAGLGETEAQ
ncbi:MAG: c-type cytochrome [Acidobacteria bacterium]|nr:c-type cytochrome [Acidobacteriota bacterium]